MFDTHCFALEESKRTIYSYDEAKLYAASCNKYGLDRGFSAVILDHFSRCGLGIVFSIRALQVAYKHKERNQHGKNV